MNLNEIRELIQLMRENQICEIDLEQEGGRVRIVSAQGQQTFPAAHTSAPGTVYLTSTPAQITLPAPAQPPEGPATSAKPAAEKPPEGTTINSPIVGTYYKSPAPDLPAYVQVGDVVEEDTVLCIVEAMKVMNEIKAEIKGRIIEILVENGHPVEFGQPLFRVAAV